MLILIGQDWPGYSLESFSTLKPEPQHVFGDLKSCEFHQAMPGENSQHLRSPKMCCGRVLAWIHEYGYARGPIAAQRGFHPTRNPSAECERGHTQYSTHSVLCGALYADSASFCNITAVDADG